VVSKKEKVYTTHLRDEKENLLHSVQETLSISKETGAKTVISHFRPIVGYEADFDESISLIEKSLVNSNIYFDINPFADTVFPIHTHLPYWAQNERYEVMLENIRNSEIRQRILIELRRAALQELVVADARGQEYLIGKNLLELSQNREKDMATVLLDLMEATKFHAMLMSKNINIDLIKPLLAHHRSLISTNSSSSKQGQFTKELKLERSFSTFSKYLEIVSEQGIPIESAIKKITYFPAQLFGLKRRGLIKESFFADLVLLKGHKVEKVIRNGKII
jgi:N-acyl-D-amino-acid deacylase